MKFAAATVVSLLLADPATAFTPFSPVTRQSTRLNAVDVDVPVATSTPAAPAPAVQEAPVIQKNQYGPSDVRYSDFLKLVNADKIEKVTFSADGTQLLGVDVDGTRLKIEALPNDPGLLSQLTDHKVCLFFRESLFVHTSESGDIFVNLSRFNCIFRRSFSHSFFLSTLLLG